MIYLLDTNVFLHLANRVAGHEHIERHMTDAGANSLRLSAISLAELRNKILRGTGRIKQERLAYLNIIVASMRVESFTAAAAERAAQIMAHLEAVGRRNEWPDVLIAGQAAESGYTLVTDDAAMLATPDVISVNWRTLPH